MPAQRLLDELIRLGGVPRPPATVAMIEATEQRLSTRLPPGMADFYLLCDGLETPTTEQIWDFFALANLERSTYRNADKHLSLYTEPNKFLNRSLVGICDVLIDLPTYVFCADADDSNYGHFFADQDGQGWLVASSFDEFIEVFLRDNGTTLLNCR
jgi:hypothetical protein